MSMHYECVGTLIDRDIFHLIAYAFDMDDNQIRDSVRNESFSLPQLQAVRLLLSDGVQFADAYLPWLTTQGRADDVVFALHAAANQPDDPNNLILHSPRPRA